jgi:ribose transport system permease protein
MTDATLRRGRPGLADLSSRFGLVIVWIALIAAFSLLAPDRFLTAQNLGNVFGSQAVLLILALGLMIPVIAGEWDLSVGAGLGLSLTIVGQLNAQLGVPIGVAVAVAIGVSVIVGAVNAFFVVVAGVPSLIATLGMATLLAGVTYGVSNTTISGLDSGFVAFGQAQILFVPVPFFLAIAVALVVWYVVRWTPGGRYLYFVGSSIDVARLAGIRVDRVRAASLVISSVVAGVSGVVLAASLGAAGPTIGPGYLLPAFAAIYLGSTCLTPGRINVWGAVIAVYFLITGVSGMQLLGAPSWVQDVFYGAIVVVAVALSRFAKRRSG